jgi:hypothetical protein
MPLLMLKSFQNHSKFITHPCVCVTKAKLNECNSAPIWTGVPHNHRWVAMPAHRAIKAKHSIKLFFHVTAKQIH